jgi:hypothetical protein
MSTPVTKSQIVKDGLRYKAKAAGSPFGETNQYAHTATMSCFLCCKHRPRNQLMTRKLLGKAQNVCAPKCEK